MLYSSEVKEVFNLPSKGPVKDAVGIEIEMELTKQMSTPFEARGWTIKGDGSLRNHGYEFVSEPTSIKKLPDLLGTWDKVLSGQTLADRIEDCPRASVHVHVNVRDYTYNQLMNILVAYTLLEGVLVAYCGKHRFGNLFALRIPEASSNFRNVMYRTKEYAPFKLNSDHRYGALNLCSVGRFGTIEFRSLGSIYNPADIDLWVTGLRHMADHAATQYKRPPDVYARYVDLSRRDFLEEFLGPLARPLMARVVDLDSLFEDGEEYAIRLLASHPDNWTYEKDFRDNPEFVKAARDNYGYKKYQLLSLTVGSARQILRAAKDRTLEINPSGADFTDWVPAVDENEVNSSGVNRITSASHDIAYMGNLPSEAFADSQYLTTYNNLLQSNTEAQARRMVFEASFLTQDWLRRNSVRRRPTRGSPSVRFSDNTSSVTAPSGADLSMLGVVPNIRPFQVSTDFQPISPSQIPRWAITEDLDDLDEDGNPL